MIFQQAVAMFPYFIHWSIDRNDNVSKHYDFSKEIKAFCICIKFYTSTPPFNLSRNSINNHKC